MEADRLGFIEGLQNSRFDPIALAESLGALRCGTWLDGCSAGVTISFSPASPVGSGTTRIGKR